MIYIGFSKRSHKIFANMFCRHFKHCAPVIIEKNRCILYQFTNCNNIHKIYLSLRDLKILEKYGWEFIKLNQKNKPQNPIFFKSLTCVQFTKKFCGIKNIKIQTPDKLFMFLHKK